MENLPKNWQIRNTSKLLSAFQGYKKAQLCQGLFEILKKSQKSKHYLIKIRIYAVLDCCEIFILSGW